MIIPAAVPFEFAPSYREPVEPAVIDTPANINGTSLAERIAAGPPRSW